MLKEWSWSHDKLKQLHKALASTDENSLNTFDFDIRPLDWRNFTKHYVLGTRHFVLKDHPDKMGSGKKKLKIFYLLHSMMQMAFISFIIYCLTAIAYYSRGPYKHVVPNNHVELTVQPK